MSGTYGSAVKRQHIVETAYELFKRDGFHATGIDRIIAEANVAKMTMYRHFPSKDELIVEVLGYRARNFDQQLDRFVARADTPRSKIAAILDWYDGWFRSSDFHGCLFAHALAEFGAASHPVFQAVSEQKAGLKQRLYRILEEAMSPEQAEGASSALLMLIEGATLMAQLGQGETAIREARKAVASLVAPSESLQ